MVSKIAVLLLILPLFAVGQDQVVADQSLAKLNFYLQQYSESDANPASVRDVLNFTERLAAKQASFKRDRDFLEYVFHKTHQRFLKHYEDYPSFSEMLRSGTYNCLTGTALYALLLDHFNIRYQVIETNYHIFLLAETPQGSVLFETTDPIRGFVSDNVAIQKRISQYKQNLGGSPGNTQVRYQYQINLYKAVDLDEVTGLLHFNLSIAAYNAHDLTTSVKALAQSSVSYPSPRIQEFSQIVLLSVLGSKLEPKVKEECLKNLYAIRQMQFDVTASVN